MRITAGKFKNKQIKTIDSDLIRPTLSKIRESLFNVLQNEIEDAIFLDLFAGSGIVGIEAVSRGASEVVFIEKNPKHYKLLKENLKNLDFKNKTFLADSTNMLERFNEGYFDVIFSDPPYNTDLNVKIIEIIYRMMEEDASFTEFNANEIFLAFMNGYYYNYLILISDIRYTDICFINCFFNCEQMFFQL